MNLEFASLSDIGQVRMKNEDAVGRRSPEDAKELAARGTIFVVADGMGAHAAGELASQMAVDNLPLSYNKLTQLSPPTGSPSGCSRTGSMSSERSPTRTSSTVPRLSR